PESTLFPYTTLFRSLTERAMELISLHWLSCEESDLNLVKLADMMGIPARSVALGARDTGADIHEISGLADTGGRVVTSARTLARSEEHTSELQSLAY